MAIYTLEGAPIEIVEARKVRVWTAIGLGRIKRSYAPIPPKQGVTVSHHDMIEVRYRITGPYPDGSGGALDEAEPEWYGLGLICADGGFAEITDDSKVAALALEPAVSA